VLPALLLTVVVVETAAGENRARNRRVELKRLDP
jgi:hypothetical protein